MNIITKYNAVNLLFRQLRNIAMEHTKSTPAIVNIHYFFPKREHVLTLSKRQEKKNKSNSKRKRKITCIGNTIKRQGKKLILTNSSSTAFLKAESIPQHIEHGSSIIHHF